jgi:hypothetical protein
MNIEEIVNKQATKLRIKHQFNELTELECKTFLNEFLEDINYTRCCKSDSELLRSSCNCCNGNNQPKSDGIANITDIG